MKKILILAYYFPPCNGIAANRPAAFANDFSKEHDVKVVTRHWEGNENTWEDYLRTYSPPTQHTRISSQLEIIRTPYESRIIKKNKFKTFFQLFKGKLDPEIDGMQLLKSAQEIILEWKPDVILVSSPPLNLLHLAKTLSKQNNIPYFVDFRDFENQVTLNPNNRLSIKDSMLFYFRVRQVKKDLVGCSGFTAVNQNFVDFIHKLSKIDGQLIYNGFEKEVFQQFKPIDEIQSENFHVSIIGTVYENQDLDIFLNSFNQVIQELPDSKIHFNFYGTNAIESIGKKIRSSLPESKITLTNKIPRSEALKKMENSHILWQPEMVGYKGVFSGKIFEYLGAKRPIIVAPSQGDVLDKLLEETNTGKSFDNSNDLATFIKQQYVNWFESKTIQYEGNSSTIEVYSREKQSEKLLSFMLSKLID